MRYHYIALTDQVFSPATNAGGALVEKLRGLGLETRNRINNVTLFTTRQTPTLALPGGAVLLGDLYDHCGHPVIQSNSIGEFSTQQGLRQHLLDHYWGEYLLIQPSDEDRNAVSFMRDPSGGIVCAHSIKPEFVTSEPSIASYLGLYREQIDWDFIGHCLVYPYMKTSRTGLAGINELLPGCILTLSPTALPTHLAWSPWNFVLPEKRQCDPTAAAQLIDQVVTFVVNAMAQTDESLLLQLSGGLDSSIVGVCLAKARVQIFACTAVSPLPGADERQYAKQVTDLLGLPLFQGILDFSESGITPLLPRDSLRPSLSPLAGIASKAMDDAVALDDIHSVYSGGGGDTVFCYLSSAAPAADALLAQGLVRGWGSIIDLARLHGCTVAEAARLTLRKLYRPPRPACKPVYTLLPQGFTAPDIEPHPWFLAPDNVLPGDRERIFELAGNQLFSDVMLRADGRRIRMPLLSQPVMEACLRIPSWLWITGGRNRAIARSAFSSQLPEQVLNRRSKGNFMNYNAAMYLRNKEFIRHFLQRGLLQARGLVDTGKLNRLLDRPPQARDLSFTRVFDLCMIENWVQQHT